MILRVLAGLALLVLLWSVFRLAMGLRAQKLARDERRAAEEARGRRVVAEIPLDEDLQLFLEDAAGFYWGSEAVARDSVIGARLLMNGAAVASFCREGAALPGPPAPEEYEGRERWDVVLYLADGSAREVACGELREGVSREIAQAVFEAVSHQRSSGRRLRWFS